MRGFKEDWTQDLELNRGGDKDPRLVTCATLKKQILEDQ